MKNKAAASAGALALTALLATMPNAKNSSTKGVANNAVEIKKSWKFVVCTDHFELVDKNHPEVSGLLRLRTKRKDQSGSWYNFSIRFDGKTQRPNLTNAQMDKLSKEMDRTFRACKEKPWGIMLRW